MLVIGIRLSSRFNLVVTSIKLAVVLFFIFFGVFFIKVAHWVPFIPPASSASASGGCPQRRGLEEVWAVFQGGGKPRPYYTRAWQAASS